MGAAPSIARRPGCLDATGLLRLRLLRARANSFCSSVRYDPAPVAASTAWIQSKRAGISRLERSGNLANKILSKEGYFRSRPNDTFQDIAVEMC